ncbi:MAG: cell division protein FtsZ [Paracoccaceae bacterium]
MTFTLRVPEHQDLKPRIIVFGVGGAGGNAVDNMILKNLEGANFVVANTDAQALEQSNAHKKIQMGVKITEGLGAGSNPQRGALAAEESLEEIVDALKDTHMCFITAGMGGGTGTGAAPIIAQAARELGVLTVGVVTKPFQFEGSKRMEQAQNGIEGLQDVVDTLIVIPNQNLFRLANEKTTATQAFELADDVLYQGVKGVTDLMVRPGLINLDFADVRAVMDEMGKAMMGTGESSGEDRAQQAAEKAIANPLLDEISLSGARGVLINVTGGNDMTLFELDEAANRIRDEIDGDAKILVGTTLDPNLEGIIRVSVVATGIEAENHIVENTNDLGVTNKALVRENSRVNMESRITSSSDKKSSYSSELESNAKINTVLTSDNERDINRNIKSNGTKFDDNVEIPSIFKVRKSGENLDSMNIEKTNERLLAAVNKEPDPSLYNRPNDLSQKLSYSSKSTLNSIFRNLTSFRGKKMETKSEKKLPPNFKVPNETLANDKVTIKSENARLQEEKLREDIPAFLRRQAN